VRLHFRIPSEPPFKKYKRKEIHWSLDSRRTT
jgi:hypothetical protein